MTWWPRVTHALSLAAMAAACAATDAGAAAAQQTGSQARTARLSASVADTVDAPIHGAEVAIVALGVVLRTDTSGRALLGPLPAGEYLVVARRFGFLPDTQRTLLRSGSTTTVRFRLRTSAYLLDTALVESEAIRDKMVDFERRRATGRGTFITREDIERRNPLTLADILRTVRGLTVRVAGGRTELRFARADTRVDGTDCPPEIWVDGTRAFGATVDEFPPNEVEGVELYRALGQIPAQYLSRTAGCGLVMIWTRSPSRIPR